MPLDPVGPPAGTARRSLRPPESPPNDEESRISDAFIDIDAKVRVDPAVGIVPD